MTNSGGDPEYLAWLRERAEAQVDRESADSPDVPPEEARQLLHELQTHQIELELQNDELCRAQAELVESRDRYADLYDFAPVAYLTISDKCAILEANVTMADRLGVEKPRLMNSRFTEFICSDSEDTFYLHRKKALETAAAQTCEIELQGQAGSHWFAQLRMVPVPDAETSGTQLRIAVTDITERRKMEQTLRQSHERLRETIAQLKTAQEQLVQQERLRALGEMASGIAHDLNNSLSPALGHAELLREDPGLPDHLRQVVDWIVKAARDSAGVVARMREFCGVSGPIQRPKPVRLAELLPDVVELTRPKWKDEAQFAGRQIEVDLELNDVSPVLGREGEIREVLTNLIFNAADALPHGGRITLRLAQTNEGVVIEVADTGIGMSPEILSRCREPFFTTKGLAGAGLGLSVCHGIVQRHEGRIEIGSTPGAGTTVRVCLPVSDIPPADDTCRTAAPLPKRRVLYIDDDPRLRAVIHDMLHALGQEVDLAEGGGQGLQMVKAKPYDLVITDLGMPEMDGSTVTVQIKATQPDLPVAILTGWASSAVQESFRSGEAPDHILSKPPSLDQLRKLLKEVLPH